MTRGYSKLITYVGIPVFGRPYASGGDSDLWFQVDWPKRTLCPLFDNFVGEAYDEDQGWDEGRLWLRQSLPVTPESCASILGHGDWQRFEAMRSFMPMSEETVLSSNAVLDGGVETTHVRPRFEDLLYSQAPPNAAGLLLEEALKRINAHEDYKLKSASGTRQRKLSFRARMRR